MIRGSRQMWPRSYLSLDGNEINFVESCNKPSIKCCINPLRPQLLSAYDLER